MRKYRLAHPSKVKKWRRKFYLEHQGEEKARGKEWRLANPEKMKAVKKKWNLAHPKKVKARHKKWFLAHPEKVREINKKRKAKRKNLGFIPLNDYFVGSEGHHINYNYVIYIPKGLHRSIWHSLTLGIGMDEINKKAFKFLKEADGDFSRDR